MVTKKVTKKLQVYKTLYGVCGNKSMKMFVC